MLQSIKNMSTVCQYFILKQQWLAGFRVLLSSATHSWAQVGMWPGESPFSGEFIIYKMFTYMCEHTWLHFINEITGRVERSTLLLSLFLLICYHDMLSTKEKINHLKFYFQMLKEVGFLAGQHEVLSDTFAKDNYKMVQEQVISFQANKRLW